jgi:hypothetical protein
MMHNNSKKFDVDQKIIRKISFSKAIEEGEIENNLENK